MDWILITLVSSMLFNMTMYLTCGFLLLVMVANTDVEPPGKLRLVAFVVAWPLEVLWWLWSSKGSR